MKVFRKNYRAQIDAAADSMQVEQALAACHEEAKQLAEAGKIMTVAMYRFENMIFMYMEMLMEDDVAAPQETFDTAGNDWGVVPEDFCSALRPYLLDWPGMNTMRKWIWMQEIYYHAVPADAKDWARKTQPECRRGRIAFLKREKLFSYVYHHRAIVEEGLLLGDRYQYIALDENILFSYFEEPRINVNIKNDYEKESKAIDAWMAVEPESHFLRSGKGNFFFIPMVFCVYRA